jgi:choline monooxygenase
VFNEDILIVRRMQKRRHGALFDGGVFSPVLNNVTHHLHQWVVQSLEKNSLTG